MFPEILVAYSDIEVEIKIEVGRAEFEAAEAALRAGGKFVSESRQVDAYFNHPDRDFLTPRYPFEWLSLRRRGRKVLINYKHWHPENSLRTTHCDEFETEIDSADKQEKILLALGFRRLVTVDKTRRNYLWTGAFTVSLDRVKGLGFFIEIEAERPAGTPEQTAARLWEVVRELGITKYTENLRGYPYTLMERKGLFPGRRR